MQFIVTPAVGPQATLPVWGAWMLRSAIALFLASVVAVLPACGPAIAQQRQAASLPPYDEHAAELFDDAIEPQAVGYELDRAPPGNDRLVRERAQVGDAVVRATVTTITSKEEDRGRSWQIGLRTIERIGGSGPLSQDFVVRIEANGASAGILRAFAGRLIGMSFIVLAREFAQPGALGDTQLHSHLVKDDASDIAAVRSAFATDRVR